MAKETILASKLRDLFIEVNNLDVGDSTVTSVSVSDVVFLNTEGFAIEFFNDSINVVKVSPNADVDTFDKICKYVHDVVSPFESKRNFESLCAKFSFGPLGLYLTTETTQEFINELKCRDNDKSCPDYVGLLENPTLLKTFFMKRSIVITDWTLGYRDNRKAVTLSRLDFYGNGPIEATVTI